MPSSVARSDLPPAASNGAQETVTFYRNMERLGSAAMPRRLTDCFNGLEGIVLGDAGLQLGQVTRPALAGVCTARKTTLGVAPRTLSGPGPGIYGCLLHSNQQWHVICIDGGYRRWEVPNLKPLD
jgi:hypothetical protein